MHIDELTKKQKEDNYSKKRRRRLKMLLLSVVVSVMVWAVILVLLFHKPSDYQRPEPIEDRQVSKYLTHVISQDLYNGTQTGEPFELVITEEGINDVVTRMGWPMRTGELTFVIPVVRFESGRVLLQGAVNTANVELIVSIEGGGFVDEQGLLNINVRKVKVGAVSLTTVAKMVAGAVYGNEATRRELDDDDWRMKIMDAILLGEAFEPVFKIERNKVRIESMEIEPDKLILKFVPEE